MANTEGISMTRFSVNQVHENPAFTVGDDNYGSVTNYYSAIVPSGLESNENYILSLRHVTKEAIPRIDLYRNTRSIAYANRPTLEELHNGVSDFMVLHINEREVWVEGKPEEDQPQARQRHRLGHRVNRAR